MVCTLPVEPSSWWCRACPGFWLSLTPNLLCRQSSGCRWWRWTRCLQEHPAQPGREHWAHRPLCMVLGVALLLAALWQWPAFAAILLGWREFSLLKSWKKIWMCFSLSSYIRCWPNITGWEHRHNEAGFITNVTLLNPPGLYLWKREQHYAQFFLQGSDTHFANRQADCFMLPLALDRAPPAKCHQYLHSKATFLINPFYCTWLFTASEHSGCPQLPLGHAGQPSSSASPSEEKHPQYFLQATSGQGDFTRGLRTSHGVQVFTVVITPEEVP